MSDHGLGADLYHPKLPVQLRPLMTYENYQEISAVGLGYYPTAF